MKKITILVLVSVLFFSCKRIPEEQQHVKNIILFIGDGMGIPHIYAGMTAQHGKLSLEKCTYVGLQKTYSLNSYITDSGAGATAIACGIKTLNGSIGVNMRGLPVKSILEYAEDNGLSTGLVATSAITHATPACFIAHQASREDYEKIAMDFLKTAIDIFIGGGRDHFSIREDSLDLLDSLMKNGYQVTAEINGINYKADKIACFTAPVHNPSELEGRGNMFPDAVAASIRFLDGKKTGFFIMAEGSQIDWAAHDNNTEGVVAEVLDFDRAINIALDFAKENGNTLVIITADHETGGMAITGGSISDGKVIAEFVTEDHTAEMVPVFAYGPEAELFTGVYENRDIFNKMMQAFGFTRDK
jgi:alkaline phosphatase